jgi:hypothetical protein
LGLAEAPLRYGLSEPPFTPEVDAAGTIEELEGDLMEPAPETASDPATVADPTWE